MSDFDPKAVKRWRRDVWREFQALGFSGVQIGPAMVMAAVSGFGTHLRTLSELTGLSEDYVRKVLRRLRKYRVMTGQTLRIRWDREGFEGVVAVVLDAMVATGEVVRSPNQKRSAAQRARAPETRARGPRNRKAATIMGPFAPERKRANPLYGLSKWEREREATDAESHSVVVAVDPHIEPQD